MEADGKQQERQAVAPQWVSVTHASVAGTAGRSGGDGGRATSVWQWLKPGSQGKARAMEDETDTSAWRSARRREDVVKGTPPCERMAHTASALGPDGTEVLVFGGMDSSSQYLGDSFLLNTKEWEWTEVASTKGTYPRPRAYHTASVISGNRVVIIGGEYKDMEYWQRTAELSLDSVDVFDLATKSWTSVAAHVILRPKPGPMPPLPRAGHAAVVLKGDRILVFGGTNKTMVQDPYLWVLHTYPTETPWRWEPISIQAKLPQPRFGHTLVAVNDTSALLFGGRDYKSPLDDVHLISPDFRETDCLEPSNDGGESFPVPSLFGQTALQIGSQMVVIGGKAYNSSSTEIYLFDMQLRVWKRQETSANPENYLPRYYHACCVFGGNKILMFGGYDMDWGCQNDIAILETGIVTSGLVTDLSRLLKPQGATLSDFTIRVRSEGREDHLIAAHRALVEVRCPSLIHDERVGDAGDVVDVEGSPAAWDQFVHFLYTGLFDLAALDDADARDSQGGTSQAKKLLTSDRSGLVLELLSINERHSIDGLADALQQNLAGGVRHSLPGKEEIHEATLAPLVDALQAMLAPAQQSEVGEATTDAKPRLDITLKLQCAEDGDAPVRAAHRFMLAARSDYFKAMLRFDGQEQPDEERLLLLSESVTPHALDVILTFLYTDRVDLSKLEVDEALELVGVANEYMMAELKLFVERFVIASGAVDEENVFYVLDMSDHFDAHELRYHCVGLLANSASTNDSHEFQQQLAALPPHLIKAIQDREV